MARPHRAAAERTALDPNHFDREVIVLQSILAV
jgi:hypothetical protein